MHQLRCRGFEPVAAVGGAAASANSFELLARLGVERVTIAFDRDRPGRAAAARAVDQAAAARRSPSIFVLDAEALAPAKDPDEFVRTRGLDAWNDVLDRRECGVSWRSLAFVADIGATDGVAARRDGLARVGSWLATLPPRLALEQEDALSAAATRCGYSVEATRRAFVARYVAPARQRSARVDLAPEL